jgi:ADP-dependent phosphofructokinase/glucokinase
MEDDLVYRLLKREEIRRSIPRGEPDRISDLLEEAAKKIHFQEDLILKLYHSNSIDKALGKTIENPQHEPDSAQLEIRFD